MEDLSRLYNDVSDPELKKKIANAYFDYFLNGSKKEAEVKPEIKTNRSDKLRNLLRVLILESLNNRDLLFNIDGIVETILSVCPEGYKEFSKYDESYLDHFLAWRFYTQAKKANNSDLQKRLVQKLFDNLFDEWSLRFIEWAMKYGIHLELNLDKYRNYDYQIESIVDLKTFNALHNKWAFKKINENQFRFLSHLNLK